jgi:hypothetical protein
MIACTLVFAGALAHTLCSVSCWKDLRKLESPSTRPVAVDTVPVFHDVAAEPETDARGQVNTP